MLTQQHKHSYNVLPQEVHSFAQFKSEINRRALIADFMLIPISANIETEEILACASSPDKEKGGTWATNQIALFFNLDHVQRTQINLL